MNVLIKPNFDKPHAASRAVAAVEKLCEIAGRRAEPLEVIFTPDSGQYIGGHIRRARFLPEDEALALCDIVMPVGGDGTVMREAQIAAKSGKPVLGLNAGRLGFLTHIEISELDSLEKLFTGEYRLLERMMLDSRISGDDSKTVYTALNDVVVRHGDSDRIASVEVTQGGELIVSHNADGVILSTPTGSTAYSMSAGGPIVSPELELIVMTAICPHSAFNCSLVLSPNGRYTVREKPGDSDGGMYVSVDGVRVGRLPQNGSVTVERCALNAKFIDLGLREFFSSLNEKLRWRR